MSIVWECYQCRKRWKLSRKICSCGLDYTKAKKQKPTKNGKEAIKYLPVVRDEHGNPKYISLATIEGVSPYSLKDAQDVESKYRTARKEGKLRIFEHRNESTWTVKDLCGWFLEQSTTQKKRSYNCYKYQLKQVCDKLGRKLLGDLTAHDLDEYRSQRVGEGKSIGTANIEGFALRSAIRMARKAKKVDAELLETVREFKKKATRGRERALSVNEFEAIYDAAEDKLKPILMTGYWTGGRTTEVLNLRWDEVDFFKGAITLKTLKQKTDEAIYRTVPMARPLFKTLLALQKVKNLRHPDRVFHPSWRISRDLKDTMEAAVKAAGLIYGRDDKSNGITFSTLRHTAEQHLRRAGVHLHVVNEILGHSDGSVARGYDRVELQDLVEAIQALERYRSGVAQSVVQTEELDMDNPLR